MGRAALCRPHHERRSAFNDLVAPGALHEIYALRASDAPAAFGLAIGLSLSIAQARSILWVRHAAVGAEHGAPYAPGLREMGLDPARLILLQTCDVMSTLQGGLEGARCAALGAVLIELRGETSRLDLTASRRLFLAAQRAKTSVFLLRSEAGPKPSAAETRWHVRAAPSLPLVARAPGRPAFDLTLLRRKNGREGLRYIVEWNRDAGCFEERTAAQPAIAGAGGARSPIARPPLSGAVVPLHLDRPGPDLAREEPIRKAG
jgi:protein ImuA